MSYPERRTDRDPLPTLSRFRDVQLGDGARATKCSAAGHGGYGTLFEGRLNSSTEHDKKVAIKETQVNPCALLLSSPHGVETFISQMQQEVNLQDVSNIITTILSPYKRIRSEYEAQIRSSSLTSNSLDAMKSALKVVSDSPIVKYIRDSERYNGSDDNERNLASYFKLLKVVSHEATVLSKLSEDNAPHIPKFHGVATRFDVENNTITANINIAMQYIEGKDLWKVRGSEVMEPQKIRDIMIGACEAVVSMHEYTEKSVEGNTKAIPLYHRDIKPNNIMVDSSGEVFIVDFGISLPVEPGQNTRQFRAMGTLGYSSPNVLRGVSDRADNDLYSLGATLFYLVSGTSSYEIFRTKYARQLHGMNIEDEIAAYAAFLRGYDFINEILPVMKNSMEAAHFPLEVGKKFLHVVRTAMDMHHPNLTRYRDVQDMLNEMRNIPDPLPAQPITTGRRI